jgi:phosphatidylserine synthase
MGAVALLGAACVLWSAVPLGRTGAPGVLLVVAATICVLAGVVRLARKDVPQEGPGIFPGVLAGLAEGANAVLAGVAWETGAAVAVVVLETLHPSRPWHTGLLGAGVVCYLLAVHQAESAVPAGVFRRQTRMLVTSLVLLAVVTGVAMVPPAHGALSGWLEVVAILAATTAGGLALPI